MEINPRFMAVNPNTGFSMPIPPGQNLVPYQAPSFTSGLGPAPVPEAVAMSRLAKLRALATSPLGLAGLGLGAALYADPGAAKNFDPFLGINPNAEGDDLGITTLGKSALRGTAHMGNLVGEGVAALGENSPFFNIPEWLFTTNDEKAGTTAPVELSGLGGEEIPMDWEGGTQASAPAEYQVQGAGVAPTSALDDLLAVIAAQRPEKAEPSPELMSAVRASKISQAAAKGSRDTLGGATKWSGVLDLLAANDEATLMEQIQGLESEQQYAKSMKDWLETYAKTGVDVEKAKRDSAKDNLKIHSTKGGFLIETRDENGNVNLKPISPFGNPSGKIEVGGRKFSSDNPLSEELGVLQNLGNIGVLNEVMVEFNKDLMAATKGITDPKMQEEAKLLTLARVMRTNPQFKATMIQKYVDAMGAKPQGASVSQPMDYLEALTQ